jgi:hypothetical protein
MVSFTLVPGQDDDSLMSAMIAISVMLVIGMELVKGLIVLMNP